MFTKPMCIAAIAVSMATAADAAALRTFVSGFGDDKNASTSCSHAQPCRTFAVAVTVTASGGEIEALDPAGYGPITISGPLTLVGLPGAAISVPTGSTGITINAGASDIVNVQGLLIDGGLGTGGGAGISFNSGGSLTVTNCVVQNITTFGIYLSPSSGAINFVIKDTLLSNVNVGIDYRPLGGTATAKGLIDHVVATNNSFGFAIQTFEGGGATTVAIVNSAASENSQDGLYINNGASASSLAISIDNSTFSGNGNNGITGSGTAKITLGRSVITANGDNGIFNSTNPNTFYTYKDNRINENTTDICVTGCNALNTAFALQ